MPTIGELIQTADAFLARGDRVRASETYRQAALALCDLGRFDDAQTCLYRAIRAQPVNALAHFELGNVLRRNGLAAEAVACFREAVRLRPEFAEARLNLGGLLHRLGQLADALDQFDRALALRPELASAHSNRGIVLRDLGRLDEARESLLRAEHLEPDRLEFATNLAMIAKDQQRFEEALSRFDRVLAARPELAMAQHGAGEVLQAMRRIDEAVARFRRAVELAPQNADYLVDLGNAVKKRGQPEQAIELYERALALHPSHAPALANRGTARLSLGRLAEGFADYERRLDCPRPPGRRLPQPRWDGSPTGVCLLVHAEQGLGDTLQFVRYLPRVRRRAPQSVLAASPRLLPLLEVSCLGPLVSLDDPLPQCDVQVPLLSLPHLFETRLETVPADIPYLAVEGQRIERWRAALQGFGGFKIGIAWQGSRDYLDDDLRSIPLAQFAPLAAVPGVRLISLQQGDGAEQLAEIAGRFEVVELAEPLDGEGAFLDTAAVMQSLDLVISSDTAMAHLAGALARPVWVALSFAPEWRWLRDRDDSPWYPTMRLFRQRQFGDWSDVFARMAAELAKRA